MGENFGLFKSFGDRLFEGETPTNLGLIGNISLLDADTSAFITRVTAAGGTLNLTEITAVNNLVLQLKIDNLWTSLKAIYPMVGSSAAACSQNLKSASFTSTFSSGWTFGSTGVTPNGTSAYMDTGFNTSSNLTQTSAHLSTYIRTNVSTNGYDIGNSANLGATLQPTFLITRYVADLAYFGLADTSYTTNTSSVNALGFWCGATNGSLTQNIYKNGTSIKTGTATAGTFANNNLYVGAINGGGAANFFSVKQTAFVSIGDGLTNTDASNFYTAVQAFQTTLSRQV